nr:MAG TPA: hypothetical protein [Caudoviricetes sp.]
MCSCPPCCNISITTFLSCPNPTYKTDSTNNLSIVLS